MIENFYYVEGSSSVKNLIQSLSNEITQNAGDYKWELTYPATIAEITNFSLLKATTSYAKSFYVRLERATTVAPTAEDQLLLDKEANAKPFTDDEITLLNRYVESKPITSEEKALIIKDSATLTTDEQEALQELRIRKKLTSETEYSLLQRYYRGESLSTDEQNQLDTLRALHDLNADELAQWETLKTNKQLYSDSLILILYKQYKGLTLLDSEEIALANYRTMMELTPEERNQLTIIKGKMDNRNHFYVTVGKEIADSKRIITVDGVNTEVTVKDLVEDTCSVPSRLAWYRDLAKNIGDWLPVQYWLNVTKDAVNIVLRGDPSADTYPYEDYLTTYAYMGRLTPIEDSASTDDEYNFGITTGSDLMPNLTKKFGERTATGTTDVCMVANKIGMPMQPHYPGFYTAFPFMDKCNTEGSRWNHKKHQFSDITLVHPVDMERGKMVNVLAGDASAIYDMDRLVYKKDTEQEENYKKFKITAPYSFLNNSANNLYCIAIRCYKTAE